ncbi:hypothetical protein DNTS_007244 [Danionella cerebrum]|uniref:Serpin domain-containing protein n=1 Tax=Danionella cerebrum TaxID=2873325 RepID=A0A553NRD7_9TELE|nr:hypothetical protein DNTS_007244 [Danionella translucida]
MEPLIIGNTKFSIDLLKQFCKVNGDVLFSPLSISSSLGLIVLGAAGDTEEQMLKVLHYNHEKIMYHDLYEEFYKRGKNRPLKMYNRLFGERSIDFKNTFLDHNEEWCFASIRNADFKKDPEGAREQINSWVKDKTEDLVPILLKSDDVDEKTLLVLISVVLFKQDWESPFESSDDRKYNGGKWTMIQQTNSFLVGDIPEADSRILEIPYKGKTLSMLILLPNKPDGLKKLLDMITYEKLEEWNEPDHMNPLKLTVKIPRFQLDRKNNLKEALVALGMTDLFTSKCDLSGMSSDPLILSKVENECVMNVTNKGSEGGSATDGVVKSVKRVFNLAPNENDFVADHPFLFYIRDNATKSIIFWGRIEP